MPKLFWSIYRSWALLGMAQKVSEQTITFIGIVLSQCLPCYCTSYLDRQFYSVTDLFPSGGKDNLWCPLTCVGALKPWKWVTFLRSGVPLGMVPSCPQVITIDASLTGLGSMEPEGDWWLLVNKGGLRTYQHSRTEGSVSSTTTLPIKSRQQYFISIARVAQGLLCLYN